MEKLKKLQQKNDHNTKALTNGLTRPANYLLPTINGKSSYANLRASTTARTPDLLCFSHLRWDFVYQRPQHLLSRCAKERRVFFVEEPRFSDTAPRFDISRREGGVWVVVPHLPHGLNEEEVEATLQSLLIDELILEQQISEYICWYYTPMALGFTRQLEPLATVFDCMDELSAFKNPPPRLKDREDELLERADVVFTGGFSLYEAKRHRHANIHPFPSSIEVEHFSQARQPLKEPNDQRNIPHPRLGFYGVIDERLDIELLDGLAQARPDWQIIMVGPVVKIDPADLPQHPNIHYLGGKAYQELPAYLSGWDVAMLPFARNESTKFISPTKTPEYLAAGVPVVSTSIRDVIRPYGQQGLVKIADRVEEFVAAAEYLLSDAFNKTAWLRQVEEALMYNSWDRTWARMNHLINAVLTARYTPPVDKRVALTPPSEAMLMPLAAAQVTGD
ncbi:MAG: glycosyltransferase family 1 protein [Acidobacteria bacterium]|nr:glycosyltransferase family 1 protein [Acidobacteriota bacterium]